MSTDGDTARLAALERTDFAGGVVNNDVFFSVAILAGECAEDSHLESDFSFGVFAMVAVAYLSTFSIDRGLDTV